MNQFRLCQSQQQTGFSKAFWFAILCVLWCGNESITVWGHIAFNGRDCPLDACQPISIYFLPLQCTEGLVLVSWSFIHLQRGRSLEHINTRKTTDKHGFAGNISALCIALVTLVLDPCFTMSPRKSAWPIFYCNLIFQLTLPCVGRRLRPTQKWTM